MIILKRGLIFSVQINTNIYYYIMASSYTSRLKLERQATGENSGNWGNLVNYVLNRIDSTVRGYVAVSVAGSANVTLVSNTSTTNTDDSSTDDQVHNKIIEFVGALTGAIHVFTDAVEGDYTLFNNTSGSHVLTFANTGHAANGVVITQGTKSIVYTNGSTIYDVGADLGEIGVTSLTSSGNVTSSANVTGTYIISSENIQIANDKAIVDANNNEQIVFSQTASAVNHLDITNAATGNNPDIKASGSDANVGISFTTTGSGFIKFNDAAYNPEATLTDGATITWDAQAQPVAKVTLAGNRTLAAASNGVAGQFVCLVVIQDGTGSRTLTWNAAYEFASDTAPTLTTTANLGDLFVFKYNGTKWLEAGRNQALTLS